MVSVLAASAVDHRFEPRSGQTNDYTIGICCVSTKYSTLQRNCKELALDNNHSFTQSILFTLSVQLSVAIAIAELMWCWIKIHNTTVYLAHV